MGGQHADVWLDNNKGVAHTECCLLAPVLDWARFGLMLLQKGEVNGNQIASPEFIEQITTPAPVSPYYGLHIWLGYEEKPIDRPGAGGYMRSEPFMAKDTFYASGYGAQRIYVVPSQELVIVRLGPATGPKPLKDGWDNSYLVNRIIKGIL